MSAREVAEQIAKQIRDEFALDMLYGTADNLQDNFEDAVRRAFEAALVAERERCAKVAKDYVRQFTAPTLTVEGVAREIAAAIRVGEEG